MNEKDKDYIIERDIKRGQLFKNFDDEPIYSKECLMCDNEIEIGQKYITNCNGDYFCSLECLLESYEVEEKTLNENDFSI